MACAPPPASPGVDTKTYHSRSGLSSRLQAEMCVVANEGNEGLHLRPLCGGVIRVNGRIVEPEGCLLEEP